MNEYSNEYERSINIVYVPVILINPNQEKAFRKNIESTKNNKQNQQEQGNFH
jgi:hypothetical protein